MPRAKRFSKRVVESTHAFEPPPPVLRGERCREVAMHFGVADRLAAAVTLPRRRARCPVAPPAPGEVLLLAGPSGSGKSSLLRLVRAALRRRGGGAIELRRVPLAERPIVELFADESLAVALRRLARVGLAEVWTWLRPPSQLSEGQRWRLRLALAIAAAERMPAGRSLCIACDEFAAVLDRVSAHVVAAALRRAVDALPERLSAAVATSHDDLAAALAPDVIVECDFGEITVRKMSRGRRGGADRAAPGDRLTSRTRAS